MGLNAAAEYTHAETLLTRGKQAGASILTAGNNDTDILCQNDGTLTVEVDMTGAASGDLTVQLIPFEADAVTLMGIALAPVGATGPTFAAGRVTYTAQFDVTAYDKVRFRVTNNNAGTQTLTRASWRLS